jgi:2-polyprenyl-3-methyl-5-hydroxy-6-metoxy-1,4-benzoquinol methylase
VTAGTASLEPEPGLRPVDPEIGRRLAELPPGARVLDWGCGYGGATLDLLRAGFDVYGVDLNPERIAWGREQLVQAGYQGNRLAALENGRVALPERSFDFVFSQDVLEHVADLDPAIAGIARLTAPRGLGVHTFPARWLVLEAHTKLPFVHWHELLQGGRRDPRGRLGEYLARLGKAAEPFQTGQ